MSEDKRWQFELEEYIRQGEPDQIEKSAAWQTAIGLQAVDGLKTSAYLLDTAKNHIEGRIGIDEAEKRIQSYYEERGERYEIVEGTKEADIVSARIASFWGKRLFSFHRQNGYQYIVDCLKVCLTMPDKSGLIILQRKNRY